MKGQHNLHLRITNYAIRSLLTQANSTATTENAPHRQLPLTEPLSRFPNTSTEVQRDNTQRKNQYSFYGAEKLPQFYILFHIINKDIVPLLH